MNGSKTFAKYLLSAITISALLVVSTNADSLLVSSNGTNQILQYDLDTGAFEKVFADAAVLGFDAVGGNLLSQPTGMDIGPDGNVYVAYRDDISDPNTGGILRFQPDGTFIDVFSVAVPNIQDLDFGEDGNLYVLKYSNAGVDCILGPNDPMAGTLDPNHTPIGQIWGVEPYWDPVTDTQCYFRSISHAGGQVRLAHKDGTTLAIIDGPFASVDGEVPMGLEFGPDGLLYCVSNNSNDTTDVGIYVFDVSTIDYSGGQGVGSFTQIGVSADADPDLNMPLGITFDNEGDILIANYDDCIAEFSTDGTYLGNKVGLFEGGLTNPHHGLIVLPDGDPDPIAGDANNDKKVDGSDVTILAGNWQKGVDDGLTASWEEGDFNGDGKVDGSDVTILAGNWQYGVTAAAASVPEPSTIVLLVCSSLGLLLWRRQR